MSLAEWLSINLSKFRGARTRPDVESVPLPFGVEAVNVEFDGDEVRTRTGFARYLAIGEPSAAIYNWVKNPDGFLQTGNGLFFINPTTTKARIIYDLSTGTAYDLFTLATMVDAMYAESGVQVFIAPLKSDGTSAGQCRVVRTYGAVVNVDKAFLGPIAAALVVTNSATDGNVTEGVHRFAYRILSRNGFLGPLCPISGGTFSPATLDATGGKQASYSMTDVAWPAEASQVYIYMTTVSNPYRWYRLDDISHGVPGGETSSISGTIDVSDDTLEANHTVVADDELNMLTQDPSGNGPFNPHGVVEIGNRIGYIATLSGYDHLFVSEPENFQRITLDQHVVTLPGFRRMTTARTMRGVTYIFGPNYTYATSDNGLKPVEWPPVQPINMAVGTPAIHGVSLNTVGNFMWVAHPNGLFYFDGAYTETPVSHFVESHWRRINWNAPAAISVLDDPYNQRVLVRAPLDSATVATHILCFSYRRGISHEEIDFSLWEFDTTNMRSLGIVKNHSSGLQELMQAGLWGSTERILRQMNIQETSPHLDNTAAFDSSYRTAFAAPVGAGEVAKWHAAHLTVRGEGLMDVTVHGPSSAKTYTPAAISLEPAPAVDVLRRTPLNAEAASFNFSVASGWFALSKVRMYWSRWISNR